ncbi:MAG: hypothetical protein NT148_01475, partial [Candidatus Nealsonbacteria bacterium]|nr:hypothetical protein [Candidatus Nealsonbacteria bacterium]
LAKATEYCKYSQPYLNLRIRQGKLKAVKFGRNWMTKKEWIDEYVEKIESQKRKYISLAEASNSSPFSQPYLHLRIRQGKLKAVKFGRNWMTTNEWLDEYLLKSKKYKDGYIKQKIPEAVIQNKRTSIWSQLFPQVGSAVLRGLVILMIFGIYGFNLFLFSEKFSLDSFKIRDISYHNFSLNLSDSVSEFYSMNLRNFNARLSVLRNDLDDLKENSLASISSFWFSLKNTVKNIAMFLFMPWQEEQKLAIKEIPTPCPAPSVSEDKAKEIVKETVKIVRIEGVNNQTSNQEYISLYNQLLSRITSLEARPVAGPTFSNNGGGAALSSSVYADGWGVQVRGSGTFSEGIGAPSASITNTLTAGRIALDSANIFLDSDVLGNMIFTDAVSGTWTLAQLAGGGGGGLGANLNSATNDILSNNGMIILGGRLPGVNNENLTFDFETTANQVAINSTTGVTTLNFNNLIFTNSTWQGNLLGTLYGGLGANITAVGAGEILYSTAANAYDSLAAGLASQILMSGGAGAPSWSTATYPATGGAAGTFLRSDGTNFINSTSTIPTS